MTQVAIPVTVIAAAAALNDVVNHPLIGAFVTADGYIDIPLVFDHKEIFEPLIRPDLLQVLEIAHDTLGNFIFHDEDASYMPNNAKELADTYGFEGKLVDNLRHYSGSDMFVIPTKAGIIVIG
jgi:hypothetical protein